MATKPQGRAPGWLLRNHFSTALRQEKLKLREQAKNPKLHPHSDPNYNLTRALYRSSDLPKVASLLESEIESGRISREFAGAAISKYIKLVNTSLRAHPDKKKVELAANAPRKSIEESAGFKGEFELVSPVDIRTGNMLKLTRTESGNIKLVVMRPPKQPL